MYSSKRIKPRKDVDEMNLEPQMRSDASLDLEASLHQPTEDNSIVANFTGLRSYIESHTLEFYHSEPVQIDVAELEIELEKLLPSSVPVDSFETLARALLQPESRPAGIRAVIAHMLFASIDFCGDSGRTILPPFAMTHMSTFPNSQDWTAEMQQGTSQDFAESISANVEQYISMHYRNGEFYQHFCYLHQMVDPEASLLAAILGA